MSINITANEQYSLMSNELSKVRDAVLGSFFVKSKREYLPHPSSVDTESEQSRERYSKYLGGSEFPEYTKSTLTSMIDKMKIDDTHIELNSALEYLAEDSDGDGLSLKGLAESCASNVLQVKTHFLLADYKGLTGVDLADVSIAAAKKLATPRATIKQYDRESLIDWSFGRVNGRMQLTYALFKETGDVVDSESGEHEYVESFLKLAIDESGYFQQKITDSTTGIYLEGEPVYPTAKGGERLSFIPIEIVSDRELQVGKLPLDTGFLTAIADLAYFRYRVSADYKESLASLVPIVIASGVEDMDAFEADNGRRFFASGALSVNVVRNENAKITITESSQTLEQYKVYFDQNERDVKAIGGVYNSNAAVIRTATEVINDSETQVSTLGPMVNSIEPALKMMCLYCGMFEGIYSVDNLKDNIDDVKITMPRDFAVSKLTAIEVKTYIELYDSGHMSNQEMLKVLDLGGWLVSDAEALGLEIETSGPSLTKD